MGKRQGLRKVVFFKHNEQYIAKDQASEQWNEYKWWERSEENESNVDGYCLEEKLKIFEFNILNDDMDNETLTEKISTHKRFDYIINKLLPSVNADVICLNEVGNGFLKKLLDESSETWMKDGKYVYISHLDQDRFFNIPSNKVEILHESQNGKKKAKKTVVHDSTQMTVENASFVNLVISRIPFTQSHNYYYQNDLVYSRRPANVITLVNQLVIVNLHLKAYLECHPIRKKQLKCLYSLFKIPRVDFKMHEENKESVISAVLEDENRFTYHFGIENLNPKSLLFAEKKEFSENFDKNVKYVLMCGDFNMNHDFEEHMITDYDLIDVYSKLHPEKVGSTESLTFDCENNPIVNLFSEDSRGRCRFDRILMHARDLPTSSSLNLEPIQCHVVENKAFEDNIFASDHFGIVTEFSINKQ